MNQILSVEKASKPKKKPKKRREGPSGKVADAVKTVRFFAIALIIFGVFNIGTGSYAIIKNKQEVDNTPKKPIITIKQLSKSEISLIVESETSINEMYYKWNDDTETKITGNGRTTIEQK